MAQGQNGNRQQKQQQRNHRRTRSCISFRDPATGEELKLWLDRNELGDEVKAIFRARLNLERKKLEQASEAADQKRRLVELGSVVRGENLVVALARVDAGGSISTDMRVRYIDTDGQEMRETERMPGFDEAEIARLEFGEKERKVTFYLPERPEEKVIVEIPAREPDPVTPAEMKGLAIGGAVITGATILIAIIVVIAQWING